MALDFEKTPANKNVTYFIGPTATGVLGITDVYNPLADELNNTGGTSGMLNGTEAVSWNDWGFGTQASETLNEPSMADASTSEEFGQSNYGGTASYYFPKVYHDTGNLASNVYDLVAAPGSRQDKALRIDGEVSSSAPATDGDLVSVYRVQSEADARPFTPGESKRYTKSFLQKSEFSHLVVVGDKTITPLPSATEDVTAGASGRFRASQQGRDVTNYLEVSSDNPDVITVQKGGVYTVTGAAAETANVTFTDPGTGDTAVIAVTVV